MKYSEYFTLRAEWWLSEAPWDIDELLYDFGILHWDVIAGIVDNVFPEWGDATNREEYATMCLFLAAILEDQGF